MSSIVDIRVPAPYNPLFVPSVSEIVEESGRCTAKSTSNEILAISLMLQSKYNNIWYCRSEKSDIRETVFSSMIATIQMLQLENSFSWSLAPYQIVCKESKAICYFGAINGKTDDDMTATKGFTPQFRSLALCILDEADQVKHQNHITAWESTAVRFMLSYGKIIFAYNPPMSKSHWAVKFFADKIKNGASRIYCTWEDIRGLLTPKTIAIIEKFKRDDPDYYEYWYLGKSIIFKGMVYPHFKRDQHIVNLHKLLYKGESVYELILGLDEGTASDSTCVTALAVMRSGVAVVLDCFENDPLIRGQQSPAQQSRALWDFLCGLLTKFPMLKTVQRNWIFECAEGGQMLKLQFEQDTHENCCLVTQKSIMGDIKRVRSMLSEEVLLFHVDNNVNTMQLIKDIEAYVFDEKTNSIKKRQRDDTIDSLEYATKLYYNAPFKR